MTTVASLLAFIDGVGGPEMLLIFVIVLMLFGGSKLPEFARGLGKTMRELKKAATGVEEEFKRAMEDDERKRNAASSTPALTTPTTDYDSAYNPEDGSTDYSSDDAGPAAPAEASAPPAETAATPDSATDPANPTPAATPAATPPARPPVVPEDYP